MCVVMIGMEMWWDGQRECVYTYIYIVMRRWGRNFSSGLFTAEMCWEGVLLGEYMGGEVGRPGDT